MRWSIKNLSLPDHFRADLRGSSDRAFRERVILMIKISSKCHSTFAAHKYFTMLEQRLKSLLLHVVCAKSIRTVNASFYKVQCFQDRKRQIDVLEKPNLSSSSSRKGEIVLQSSYRQYTKCYPHHQYQKSYSLKHSLINVESTSKLLDNWFDLLIEVNGSCSYTQRPKLSTSFLQEVPKRRLPDCAIKQTLIGCCTGKTSCVNSMK